jgi:4-hydroxy-2-oxoheptanedioate aldolase
MPIASLAERLRAGAPLLSAWCGIAAPAVAGLLAREPFDAVTLDLQHGGYDAVAAAQAIPLIAAAQKPALARVPVGEFQTASKLLDAGASAIIAPMINTVEDAQRFVSFVKLPPVGARSWGPHGGLTLSGLTPSDYLAQANDFSLALAMIETREALDAIDAILATPGLDGIFLGPADLSVTLSQGRTIDPTSQAVDQALAHALERGRAAQKFVGLYATTGARASIFLKQGFSLVAVASDSAFLRLGAQETIKAARG